MTDALADALALPKNQEYPLDPNGVPMKLGYRPPFNSETGREAGLKGARAMQDKALARKLTRDAKIAVEALREVKSLIANFRKSLSNPRSATNHAATTRDSKSASISPTIRPRLAKQNASQVKPEAVVGGASASERCDTQQNKSVTTSGEC